MSSQRRPLNLPNASRWTLPVRELMTVGVRCVGEETPVEDVRRALGEGGALLVTGRLNPMPLGWVTAADVVKHAGEDPEATTAVDLISQAPVMIDPGEPACAAAEMLRALGVDHLLVAATGSRSFEGVVTARDLLEACGP